MGFRLEAVIFDMDGVLIDSEPLHFGVLRAVLADVGHDYTNAENEEFLGSTTEAMFATLIARHRLAGTVKEYERRYDAEVLRVLQQPHQPQPGVLSLIEQLHQARIEVALASSSHHTWIQATLRSVGLANAFEVIVSGEDVSRPKPEPDIYLLAAERLGLPPERCMAIEDSPNGVASAHAAGMRVVGVRTPYTAYLRLDGADLIVDSLADLDLSRETGA